MQVLRVEYDFMIAPLEISENVAASNADLCPTIVLLPDGTAHYFVNMYPTSSGRAMRRHVVELGSRLVESDRSW
jgi:hypothetical protein